MSINTGQYCLVNIPVADTVLQGPQQLPQNWQAPDGTWHYNLNNDTIWTDPALLAIGWYPYVESDAGSPGLYYTRSLSDFVINPTNVVRNAIYTQLPIDDVKIIKDTELDSQLRQFTYNQAAVNPKIAQYVQDEAKWYTSQQTELARLDDWDAVANFDTTKPEDLQLTNTYIGASYVNQGLRLRAENDAAVGEGLPARWDPTELSSFISSNQLAADDPSGNTPVVQPSYKIRQGVATPGEQFSRVVIYRLSRDDPNPALQMTYKMRLTNRLDSRDLYVFSYTNGTYLTWRKFEETSPGVWELEATSAEWQYVPGDMSFIFSYGSNPAVEADYFTDRVDFPAGVMTREVLVSWDVLIAAQAARGRGRGRGRGRR